MIAKENLKKSYIEWLNTKLAYKDLEAGAIEITTPFLDRHNDRLQIFAIPGVDGNIKLSDDGYILSDLLINGVDLSNSIRRKQIFETVINGFGVSFDSQNNELYIVTNSTDFPRKKHALIQAMITVNDMFMTTKTTVSSIFSEDVGRFLDSNNIRYTENIFLNGKSGYTHNFNFVIPHFKETPERVIQTMNTPSKGNLSNIIFAWSDTRNVRNNKNYSSFLYVFINDQEKVIDQNIINAFKHENIHAIPWSSRDSVIKELSA